MGRVHVDVPVLPLAYRRPEAAAACGVSVETFDRHVRARVPAVRLGAVTLYPLAGLQTFLAEQASIMADDLRAAS